MKKFLVTALMLLCTTGLFATDWGYIQPTLGIGGAFFDYGGYDISDLIYSKDYLGNQFGITAGADIMWNLWNNKGTAEGDLYVGADLAFEYWVPTEHKHDSKPVHVMRLPIQANIAYEFKVNAGPLQAAGPYFSTGIGLNFVAVDSSMKRTLIEEKVDKFKATWRWGLGGSLAFASNWSFKAEFGGDAFGSSQKSFNWNNNSFFMIQAGYRF